MHTKMWRRLSYWYAYVWRKIDLSISSVCENSDKTVNKSDAETGPRHIRSITIHIIQTLCIHIVTHRPSNYSKYSDLVIDSVSLPCHAFLATAYKNDNFNSVFVAIATEQQPRTTIIMKKQLFTYRERATMNKSFGKTWIWEKLACVKSGIHKPNWHLHA